jgi:hypothetical protein
MTDGSKKKFMTAIFGEDGTQIDSATAAALLAATCSGGNPEIGNKGSRDRSRWSRHTTFCSPLADDQLFLVMRSLLLR